MTTAHQKHVEMSALHLPFTEIISQNILKARKYTNCWSEKRRVETVNTKIRENKSWNERKLM
jgi:hypothetical protein